MKVAHYLPSLNLSVGGGVTRSVLDMADALASAGHQISIVTHESGDAPNAWTHKNNSGVPDLHVIRKPYRTMSRFSKAQLRDWTQLVSSADLIHLHGVWTPANLQIASLAQREGKPYVITIHGMLGRWSMSQKLLKKRLFLAAGGSTYLKNAAKLMFSCEEERKQASAWVNTEQGAVHPLPLDLDAYRMIPESKVCCSALSIPESDWPAILFFSTLKPVKGVEIAIDAIHHLREIGLNCRLLVAGTGDDIYEAALREQVNRLKLNDRVQFLGYVRGEIKVSLLAMADINIFVSNHENFGFAWAESMAAGTPVIISKGVGPWRELVQGGGVVVADRDKKSVAIACESILNDEEAKRIMGERGKKFVHEFLDPTKVTDQIAASYKQVLGEHENE